MTITTRGKQYTVTSEAALLALLLWLSLKQQPAAVLTSPHAA